MSHDIDKADTLNGHENKGSMLQIFSAGVASTIVRETIEAWEQRHPEMPAVLTVCGSVELIRRVLSGEDCDVLIVADNGIIESMMMPEYAQGYVVFAGNRMVVAANKGYEINSGNWKEKLLEPDATFSHHSPYDDPGGYRSVMSMMLAEKTEPGLAEKLLYHPGHYGMERTPDKEILPEIKYSFDYYSNAAAKKMPFAQLPEIMDLSSETLADEYADAKFAVDEKNIVTGTPICHALTIPAGTKHPDEAREFSKYFMEHDFAARGFIERYRTAGKDILHMDL